MTSTDSPAGVPLGALSSWMTDQKLGSGPITHVEMIAGGTQNILLRFQFGGRPFVLRRPPISKRKNSDETMRREARVLDALEGTAVPHPALIVAHPDDDVIGAAFYLMEPVSGVNPLPLPPAIQSSPDLQRRLGESMIDALAAIGGVDHVQVGLGDLGRPGEWLERQVPRWRSQLDSYSGLDGYPGPELPHLERVATWLTDNAPTQWHPGLMHGDFHFGNVIIDPNEARLAAVVDWELTTIGDPLLDLGHLLANWPDKANPARTGVPDAFAMPPPREAVERYALGSGRDVTSIRWFAVLACYRLGILLEGSNARAYAGLTSHEIGEMLGARAKELFEQANVLLDSNPFS